MKKQILVCLFAVLLFLGAAAAPQQAEAAGTLAISSVSGAKGETAEVTVTLKSDDVYSGNFNIRYDSTVLKLVSSTPEPLENGFCVMNDSEDGTVRVTFAVAQTALTDCVLVRLIFRITADTPVSGSKITAEELRLYTETGAPTAVAAISGGVAKKVAHLGLSSTETAESQAVGVTVRIDGGLHAAGGNFTFTYDPTCLEVRSVLPLEGLKGAAMTYHVETPGKLNVSFSAAKAVPEGELCSIILQTVSAQQQDSSIHLTQVRLYDENSEPLDAAVSDGTVSVTVPSERDPKLWIVGGALQEDGTAKIAVVLQGRGKACGGNFTLCYDHAMQAKIESNAAGCQVKMDSDGQIQVSWGAALPFADTQELITIEFSGAPDKAKLTFDAVRLYDEASQLISVVDVRPATIEKQSGVTAVIDEKKCAVDGSASVKKYTVAVDVADMRRFSNQAVEKVAPVLALYREGRLVGLSAAGGDDAVLSGGVGELSLSAETKEEVTSMRVFLMSDESEFLPLCAALSATVPNNQ